MGFLTLFDLWKRREAKPPKAPTPFLHGDAFAVRTVRAMQGYNFNIDVGPEVYNIVYVKNVTTSGAPRKDRGRYYYDDCRMVLQMQESGRAEIVEAWDATVDPFISVNAGGAAQIECPSQQRVWIVGMHNGRELGLLQRAGKLWIVRDTNKNFVRDEGDTRMLGNYGINQHSGTSAGCLTVPLATQQREFMRIIMKDRRYQADNNFVFTTTILPASAVQ